jgi:hypothetical protein
MNLQPPPPPHFLEWKFPWLEARPWYGYIVGFVGLFISEVQPSGAFFTHAGLDGWLDTGAKAGGLCVLIVTLGIQILNFRRKLRQDDAAMARFDKFRARAARCTRFFTRRRP